MTYYMVLSMNMGRAHATIMYSIFGKNIKVHIFSAESLDTNIVFSLNRKYLYAVHSKMGKKFVFVNFFFKFSRLFSTKEVDTHFSPKCIFEW